MGRLSGRRIVVAGAGAIGSVLTLRLQDEGAQVLLADPAPRGANASGVAAGMLAPAFEAALDASSSGHFELLKTARDLWPALVERLPGLLPDRSGALWVGDEASNAAVLAKLQAIGAKAEALGAAAAEALSPGVLAPAGAVFTPEDWSLEPPAMLAALQSVGGEARAAAVQAWSGDLARLSDASIVPADTLVLATGLAAQGLFDPPLEFAAPQPIKGQIATLAGAGPRAGPVARGEGVYVVPRAAGALAGATMEAGLQDVTVDPSAVERLRASAARLYPALRQASAVGAAGVRAATPDGLPLVGESGRPGVWLAMGARRNGWLLAPLIAQVLADQLAGGDGGPWAAAFAPGRFCPGLSSP